MPERGFASETWNSDEWFQDLSRDQRYLFIYLWTNDHCNPAGLYHITLKTISDEALFSKDELRELLNSLAPKVIWYPETNLIWVKNFIKRQSKSSKFVAAAAKCLTSIRDSNAIEELLDYNMRRYSISIPYQYYIDRISILTRVTVPVPDTAPDSGKEGVSLFGSFSLLRGRLLKAASGTVDRLVEHEMVKQELAVIGRDQGLEPRSEYQTASGRVDLCLFDSQDTLVAAFEIDVYEPRAKSLAKLAALDCPFKCVILRTGESPYSIERGIHLIGLGIGQEVEHIPRSESENEESLCEGDQEIISVWCSVKGFTMSPADASALVASLRTEFAEVDILEQSKVWAARKLSEPLTRKSRPSSQIWNFMLLARKFAQERREREQGKGKRAKVRPREAYRGKW